MGDWNWLTDPGAVGELPVEIRRDGAAPMLPDGADDVSVTRIENSTGEALFPGDVCLLTVSVLSATTDSTPTEIAVEALDVEFGETVDRQPEFEELAQHLETARERRQERRDEDRCDNCRTIDADTRLTVERNVGERDLHYCAQCERLLSTREYRRWADVDRPDV